MSEKYYCYKLKYKERLFSKTGREFEKENLIRNMEKAADQTFFKINQNQVFEICQK